MILQMHDVVRVETVYDGIMTYDGLDIENTCYDVFMFDEMNLRKSM